MFLDIASAIGGEKTAQVVNLHAHLGSSFRFIDEYSLVASFDDLACGDNVRPLCHGIGCRGEGFVGSEVEAF